MSFPNSTTDPNTTAAIAVFDHQSVWNSYRVSEWGWGFFVKPDGTTPVLPNNGYGWCKTSLYHDAMGGAPTTKAQAELAMKQEYLRWAAKVDGRLNSRPSWSFYLHEPMRWSLQAGYNRTSLGTGFEINGATDGQAHVAFARGASRQWGVPWMVDVSPWHEGSHVTTGPTRLDGDNKTWIGLDSGKSASFIFRATLYAWFSGAAVITAEGASGYAFTYQGEPLAPWPCHAVANGSRSKKGDLICRNLLPYSPFTKLNLTAPHGVLLAKARALFGTRDRGVSYTPIAVVIDVLAGYNGSPCGGVNRTVWGALPPSPQDQELGLLFERQLVPGGFAYPNSTDEQSKIPVEDYETLQLRATPNGEMVDVVQTDVSSDLLGWYSAFVFAGEVTIDANLISMIEKAATLSRTRWQSKPRLYLRDHQITGLPTSALDTLKELKNCTITRGGEYALPTSALKDLSSDLMPFTINATSRRGEVSGVQWSVNKQQGGVDHWVLHLANNDGISKPLNQAESHDARKSVSVTATAKFPFSFAVDWVSGQVFHEATDGCDCIHLTIEPGNVAILEFQ